MTIKEMERMTGLSRASVRFYESEGLIHPRRGENGYRDYSREDLAVLEKIKLLRRLDCSLEEIRSLQQGKLAFGQLLTDRLEDLSRRQAEASQAIRLCQQLQADGVNWDKLDPSRYPLPQDTIPLPEDVSDLRFTCPWRRFFARFLDYELCVGLGYAILGLGFRINFLQRSGLESYLIVLLCLCLNLLLEPLSLHFFGTTPGKWIMGLRLTRSDGSPLSLPEAYRRTSAVLLLGQGLHIPLLNIITSILAYRRCSRQQEQPWALEDEAWSDGTDGKTSFWEQRRSFWRAAGFVGCYGAMVALTIGIFLLAASPRYHTPLTPQHFVDNYNHLSVFSAAPNHPAYRLQADGTWTQFEPSHYVFGGQPAPLSIQVQDGMVTGVSFAKQSQKTDSVYSIPLRESELLLHALLGDRNILSNSPALQVLQSIQ